MYPHNKQLSIAHYLICAILLLAGFSQKTLAQKLQVSPQQTEVGQQETFQVVYSVENANFSDFQAPDFSKFHIVGGPNRSQSMQIVNGKTSQQVSLTYVLQPKKNGTFTIPPATATINGKSVRSGKVKVTVTAGGKKSPSARQSPAGRTPQGQQNTQSGGTREIDLEEGIFLTIAADTNQVYQGQQISISYRLYTAIDITNYDISGVPALTGFWVQDQTPDRLVARGREVIDDITYTTYDLKEYALFPQRSGSLEIDPMQVEITGRIPDTRRRNSFFQTYRSVRVDRTCDPLPITALPFPEEGKPESFNGAVGQFQMTARTDAQQVKAGESVKLTVQINGTGNIKLIEAPSIIIPENFDSFDPIIKDDIYERGNKVAGTKIFEYTLIPTKPGNVLIPKVTFSYFNPETKTYQTLNSPNLRLTVGKGDGTFVTTTDDEMGILRPIKQSVKAYQKGGSFFTSPLFWSFMALPFVLFPVFYYVHRRREDELADVVSYKRKRANKVALQRLSEAKTLMGQGEKKPFYNEVIRAIWGYLDERLNIPMSELSQDKIRSILMDNNVPEPHIAKLLQTITYCEMALFAPVKDADNLEGTYQNTLELVADIEEALATEAKRKQAALTAKMWLPFALLLLGASQCSYANDTQTQLQQANDYALNGKYEQAVPIYENLIKEDFESVALFYNLGNCYYHLKNASSAVLNYERALRLAPKDGDILHNLALTQEELIEKKVASYPPIFYKRWWTWLVTTFGSGTWAIFALLDIWLAFGLAILFVQKKEILFKKRAFTGAVVCLFFALLCTLFAYNKYQLEYHNPHAVVFAATSALKNGPNDNSKAVTPLSPGIKVQILEQTDAWAKVRLSDGQEGWVKMEEVTVI